MKRQLSTLQQLIGIMDPELFRHLGMRSSYFTSQFYSIDIYLRKNRRSKLVFLLPVRLFAPLQVKINSLMSISWVLIAFKREFPFDDVLRLWEVLWTDHYTSGFVLFVALAVLESHRDMILRYLVEVWISSPLEHDRVLTAFLNSLMKSSR